MGYRVSGSGPVVGGHFLLSFKPMWPRRATRLKCQVTSHASVVFTSEVPGPEGPCGTLAGALLAKTVLGGRRAATPAVRSWSASRHINIHARPSMPTWLRSKPRPTIAAMRSIAPRSGRSERLSRSWSIPGNSPSSGSICGTSCRFPVRLYWSNGTRCRLPECYPLVSPHAGGGDVMGTASGGDEPRSGPA